MIEILEDESPFFVRFLHSGIEQVLELIRAHAPDPTKLGQPFSHVATEPKIGKQIIESLPYAKSFVFNPNRVSYFVSQPGLYYNAHKDGWDHRFSINYTCDVRDDKCVTSWYKDEDGEPYNEIRPNFGSRELLGFDRTKHTPWKQMVARPNECILFNTDIYHDWDNASPNSRTVLTLRLHPKIVGLLHFKQAREILKKHA